MLRAFLVAPIGAAFVYGALFLIDPLDGPAVIGALWIVVAVVTTSYIVEAVIAWPAFLLLRRIGLANPVVSIIGGLMLASGSACLLDLPDSTSCALALLRDRWPRWSVFRAVFWNILFWRPQPAFAAGGG